MIATAASDALDWLRDEESKVTKVPIGGAPPESVKQLYQVYRRRGGTADEFEFMMALVVHERAELRGHQTELRVAGLRIQT